MFRIFVKLIKVRVSTSSQSFNIIFHLFSSTGNTCKIPSPKHQAFSSNTSQRAFFFRRGVEWSYGFTELASGLVVNFGGGSTWITRKDVANHYFDIF